MLPGFVDRLGIRTSLGKLVDFPLVMRDVSVDALLRFVENTLTGEQ